MKLTKLIKKIVAGMPYINRLVRKINELSTVVAKKDQSLNELRDLVNKSRSPGLFNSENDFLTERLMAHPVKNPAPLIPLASRSPEERENRIHVAERLLSAYRLAQQSEKSSVVQREGDDLWSGLLQSELSEMGEILDSGDAKRLAAYLMEFGNSYTWFGGISTSVDGYNRNLDTNQVALTYLDKLVCLAESLGVLNLENPESGPWGDNLFNDIDTLVEKIERRLDIDITPPLGIIHTDGIAAKEGIFHYRHINALYMASRIKELNLGKGAVAEIGGGIGLTAMYAHRLGCQTYTIYDLPLTCMLIGHYLIHALGEDQVVLYGEPYSGTGVRILPFWEFYDAPSKSVNITVSQDALPEIADNLVYGYLEHTKRITKDYFLSMNHETFSPRTVCNFVKESQGFIPLYRFKAWVREGYVEECYKIQ